MNRDGPPFLLEVSETLVFQDLLAPEGPLNVFDALYYTYQAEFEAFKLEVFLESSKSQVHR